MNTAEKKTVQYLNEAHAMEDALVRVLQSQIAMTPRGSYRTALENHLDETRGHAERIAARLEELGERSNPMQAAIGAGEDVAGQALAVGKAPIDLVRGTGGEEKILKNAKDACADRGARDRHLHRDRAAGPVGRRHRDGPARRVDPLRGGAHARRVMGELPKLTGKVVGADIEGDPSYDITTTGAGEAVARRRRGDAGDRAQGRGGHAHRRAQARRVPGVARAEGQVKGALASEDDLAIAGYDDLSADEITAPAAALAGRPREGRLLRAPQPQAHDDPRRVTALRGDEPWPGYDELTVAEVQAALAATTPRLDASARTSARTRTAPA